MPEACLCPSHVNLLVIGGVAAGTKAAAKARRERPDLSIAILTEGDHISYAVCGLPYYLANIIRSRQELLVVQPDVFELQRDIRVFVRHRVTSMDAATKTVQALDLNTNQAIEITYDKLVFATGARPVVLPVPGIDLRGVTTLRTIADGDRVRAMLETGKVTSAVVVGGGFIGIETAEALTFAGVKTTIVEAKDHILNTFDRGIALLAQKHIEEKGVDVRVNTAVTGFRGGEKGELVTVQTDQGEIEAQLAIVSVGVRPNVEVATAAGAKTGPTRALAVDDHMRTNLPDVYAAGDCCEVPDLLSGQPRWWPMGSTANKQGRAVGINVAGGDESFPGVLGTQIVRAFDFTVGKVGLGADEARAAGFDIEVATVPSDDIAHYYPGYREITMKMIADRATGRLLGAQVVGEGIADKPLDVCVTAITLGATVEQLKNLDLCYAPPFAPAMSVVNVAADVIDNKIKGRVIGLDPCELQIRRESGEAPTMLDVRTEPEVLISSIPGVVNVPLDELSGRLGELDPEAETVVICKVGKRAYLAANKLQASGFSDVKILDGGVTAWPFELE